MDNKVKIAGKYIPLIGLEIHAQLATDSKLFCSCANRYGAEPNSLTCPVCLGLPGSLPVLNRKAVELAVMSILAMDGHVNLESSFDRKNYFYPDLPKGYQITQYENPIGSGGYIIIKDSSKTKVNIRRIHLEEDAGKMIHNKNDDYTFIDFNRCGAPLIEIVTEPEMSSPRMAAEFLKKLHHLLKFMGLCYGDMEKGQFRCDANISLKRIDTTEFGDRTEIKNLNSFRFIEQALEYEIKRQNEVLESGKEVKTETYLWNEQNRKTELMRDKEGSDDYRYFPEPDLPGLVLDADYISGITNSMGKHPDELEQELIESYGLNKKVAEILVSSRDLADYFNSLTAEYQNYQTAANWIINDLLAVLNDRQEDIGEFRIKPQFAAELLKLIDDGDLSRQNAAKVLRLMADSGESPKKIMERNGLSQIKSEQKISEVIQKVIDSERDNIKLYLSGRDKLFDHFIGRVMAASDGRAEPEIVRKILKERLGEFKS